MRKVLILFLTAFTLQGTANLSAQPAAPVVPAIVDPDAQYVLGPDSQPQAGERKSC